jgi:hypothetical protein
VPELLTVTEEQAMEATVDLLHLLRDVIRSPGSHHDVAQQDLEEVVLHIHALQHMILAQAAARAYPDRYRLLGRRGNWAS